MGYLKQLKVEKCLMHGLSENLYRNCDIKLQGHSNLFYNVEF